jgi:formylglycine-generating enzyme required for sulfatase activity
MKKIIGIYLFLLSLFLSCNVLSDVYNERWHMMVFVPGGTFQRDATSTNLSTVSAFYMSEKEITRAQFTAVTGLADPSNTGFSTGTSDPVQMINWYQALVFCNKLSMVEGLTPVYTIDGSTNPAVWIAATSGIPIDDSIPAYNAIWDAAICNWSANGYRLPTEMEWEWAAMGATSDRSNGYTGTGVNTTGYTKGYAGSTELLSAQLNIGNYAWYSIAGDGTGENSNGTTHPVGTKLPNELGFYDMSGNVWDWCWDWFANWSILVGTQIDYRGAAPGMYRVLRGGDWYNGALNAAVAYRNNLIYPFEQSAGVGFRVVRR